MLRPEAIDRLQQLLFASSEELERAAVPAPTRKRLLRLRELYARWIENPQWNDRCVVRILMDRHGVSQSMAYEDVYILKRCLGNLNQLTRDWAQFLFMQRLEVAFRMAAEKEDVKAYIAALNALGRYARLDKDELAPPDYADIRPLQLEATTDPRAAGFDRIENLEEREAQLRRELER